MNNFHDSFGGSLPEPHGNHGNPRNLMRSLDAADDSAPLDNTHLTGRAAPAETIPSKVKSGSDPTPTHTAELDHTPHYGHEPSSAGRLGDHYELTVRSVRLSVGR